MPDNLHHITQPDYAKRIQAGSSCNQLDRTLDLPRGLTPLRHTRVAARKGLVPGMCHEPDDEGSAACGRPAKGETPHSHLYHSVSCARPLRGLIGIASSSLRFPKTKATNPAASCEKANPEFRYDLGMHQRALGSNGIKTPTSPFDNSVAHRVR